MALPQIASGEQWLAARRELLAREKELTRAHDLLNADRRRLPMVAVEKEYGFDGPAGRVGLPQLFEGRRQLVVQHFMFDPEWEDGCGSCTAAADELSVGLLEHLAARDTTFAAVSRAPLVTIDGYRRRRGWTFPWYSSYGSAFNYDFHVTLDSSVAPVMFNYRDASELREAGLGWVAEQPGEQPGYSCFLRDGNEVFHTYSTFGRGTEQLGGGYAFLDMTALGRQEEWEEPKDRVSTARGAVPDFFT